MFDNWKPGSLPSFHFHSPPPALVLYIADFLKKNQKERGLLHQHSPVESKGNMWGSVTCIHFTIFNSQGFKRGTPTIAWFWILLFFVCFFNTFLKEKKCLKGQGTRKTPPIIMCLNCNSRLIRLKRLHCEKCWQYVMSFLYTNVAPSPPSSFTRWCSRRRSPPWRSCPSVASLARWHPAWQPAGLHWEDSREEGAERHWEEPVRWIMDGGARIKSLIRCAVPQPVRVAKWGCWREV